MKDKRKTDKKWLLELLNRRVIIALLIIAQFAFLSYLIISSSRLSQSISAVFSALSILVALHIVSKKGQGAYKLSWMFLVLAFPLLGGFLYLFFNLQASRRIASKRSQRADRRMAQYLSLPKSTLDEAKSRYPQYSKQIGYLQNTVGFPVYDKTTTRYLSPGEEFLPALLEELEKAQKYIFLEFFIIEEGEMWGSILEVLKRKAQEGVRVRILYDDIGCFLLLEKDYVEKLKAFGIEAAVFNPFKPVLSAVQNNRDHRKIVSIDGRVAFTGGINLADEYINAYEKHGYWKDSAIMLSGKGAWSLTLIFLQNWALVTGAEDDIPAFFPNFEDETDGFVQPYADSPLDSEPVSQEVYMQMIHDAKRTLYIMTPYLIIDDNMVSALVLSAKSGVDVRIITPKVWDKKAVHMTTRSYYPELVKGGVRVYEYTPGFIHSKIMLIDDEVASIGTVNLDFRSLYLHFECGVKLYGSSAVNSIKEDFLKTLERSEEISGKDIKNGFLRRLFRDILRLFAPLM